ncbi:YggT family protein [Oscillochloris sp. ZM17-4]|uniref:YggT family protein n=1 Tax=Oscillochloris sp. ZM17-4 TaxID=2866714 RepID=UPI001C72B3EF|nr:YggT family protein [Oscillochloris sp. ZM17-4]MBX0330349.1 YggT family protein [Oscillochloris sp. ZM17-4]
MWLAGAAEALLLARLLARLLAARPDSPAVAALYAATWPLVAPLAALDQAQRQFGATLEISTLTIAILVPAGACLLWLWAATRSARGSS